MSYLSDGDTRKAEDLFFLIGSEGTFDMNDPIVGAKKNIIECFFLFGTEMVFFGDFLDKFLPP